jgi:predicted alpha/beta-fold hydrolase
VLDLDFPPFQPHPWLEGPHAQTLATQLPRRALVRRSGASEARLFRVDATSEVLAWCRWQPDRGRAPLVLLLHGLAGSAEADHMLGLAEKCFLTGFSTVRLNMRGCGDTEHLARSIYHAGMTEDIEHVARALHEQDGVERVYLAGCSLGGGMALRWLGELGAAAPAWLRGAAVVSPAVDLAASQHCLDEEPGCRVYREFFLRGLKEQLRARAKMHPGFVDVSGIGRIKTLRDFDRVYTGPLSRYETVERYYTEASALPLLGDVRRPALIVTAQDDPFIPYASFRAQQVQQNAWIRLVAPQQGGHVAFIGGRPSEHRSWCDLDRHWAENRVAQFLDHLEQGSRR